MVVTRSGGRGTLLIAASKPPSPGRLAEHAEQLRASLGKALGDEQAIRVGIGPVVASAAEAYLSHQRAEDALRVAAVVPGFGPVVSYDDLGIYRLLVHLPLAELPGETIPPGLRQLIEQDAAATLVTTLETYLDEAGDARATVERLKVHRTSLYYRLSRIEEITGMSLANGGDRLSLHLGLKLARLSGLLPGQM
jgi:sugar diacid utilization regulator